MSSVRPVTPVCLVAILLVGLLAASSPAQGQAPPAKRPMTFLDMQHLEQVGTPRPSPDGRWLLYTLNKPDWKEARRQSDIYVVSIENGIGSTRQLTFSRGKNEAQPAWAPDGSFFVYASNRDAPPSKEEQNQLYLMRIDGGEGLKITDAKEGVSTFAFSRDGAWLVYRSGKAGEEQLYRLGVKGIEEAKAEQLTRHEGGVGAWRWSPDGRRIYFIAPERLGVPTELFVYPGKTHGIPDQRNQLVKAVSEMAWMDYYVRGIGEKFSWRMVLDTLPGEETERKEEGEKGTK